MWWFLLLLPDVTAIQAAAVHAAIGLDRHRGFFAVTLGTDVIHARTDIDVAPRLPHLAPLEFWEAATVAKEFVHAQFVFVDLWGGLKKLLSGPILSPAPRRRQRDDSPQAIEASAFVAMSPTNTVHCVIVR